MAKKKIRLSESQLISLIRKSLNEQVNLSTASTAARDIKYNLTGDVKVSDLEKTQTVLNDRVFGQTMVDGTCALKKVMDYFKSVKLSGLEVLQTSWDDSGSLGDLLTAIRNSKEPGSPEFEDIKKELIDSINKELNGFCKPAAPAQTQQQQQQQTQANKFSCAESESTFRAFGTAPNQYGEVQWQGGTLQFYLDGRDLGEGAPVGNNVLYQKGGKKWTTKGDCSEGGPGKQRGLVLGTWTVKTN
jgi:hypothetical protein